MNQIQRFEEIARVVADTLRTDFVNIEILEIRVDTDIDFDGDEVLKIDVIFKGTRKNINARSVSGAVRHVRPKLASIGERAFPLLSFVSDRDAGKRLATA